MRGLPNIRLYLFEGSLYRGPLFWEMLKEYTYAAWRPYNALQLAPALFMLLRSSPWLR